MQHMISRSKLKGMINS